MTTAEREEGLNTFFAHVFTVILQKAAMKKDYGSGIKKAPNKNFRLRRKMLHANKRVLRFFAATVVAQNVNSDPQMLRPRNSSTANSCPAADYEYTERQHANCRCLPNEYTNTWSYLVCYTRGLRIIPYIYILYMYIFTWSSASDSTLVLRKIRPRLIRLQKICCQKSKLKIKNR